jgi:hypothetical protein
MQSPNWDGPIKHPYHKRLKKLLKFFGGSLELITKSLHLSLWDMEPRIGYLVTSQNAQLFCLKLIQWIFFVFLFFFVIVVVYWRLHCREEFLDHLAGVFFEKWNAWWTSYIFFHVFFLITWCLVNMMKKPNKIKSCAGFCVPLNSHS